MKDPSALRKAGAKRASRLLPPQEMEKARNQGQMSCAECKRLKLKCDKGLPCTTCVRRGCAAICPNGKLSASNGTRFILSDTEALHQQIMRMSNRIRSLEEALSTCRCQESTVCHPLLTEELKRIKFGADEESPQSAQKNLTSLREEEILDAAQLLGSFAIEDSGSLKYFGPAARSEALIMMEPQSEPQSNEALFADHLHDVKFVWSEHSRWNSDAIMMQLFPTIPTKQRAMELTEIYLQHVAWMSSPLLSEHIDEILSQVYQAHEECSLTAAISASWTRLPPHRLAILLLIFALGALMDLKLPPFNEQAFTLFRHSQTALSLRSVFRSPTLESVQAVVLSGFYQLLDSHHCSFEGAWNLTAMALKLAQACGLHRNCSSVALDPVIIQRRRAAFWEILSLDMYLSVTVGRPTAINLSYCDCEFPLDKTPGQPSLRMYKGVKDTFSLVVDLTLNVKAAHYDRIMQIDRALRDQLTATPADLTMGIGLAYGGKLPFGILRNTVIMAERASALIYLHQSSCLKALRSCPEDPLRSKFSASVLATYEEASWFIRISMFELRFSPTLVTRHWTFFTHLYSAALILGTIVARSPAVPMAPAALDALNQAINAFQQTAQDPRSRRSLAVLTKLRENARSHFQNFQNHGVLPDSEVHPQKLFGSKSSQDALVHVYSNVPSLERSHQNIGTNAQTLSSNLPGIVPSSPRLAADSAWDQTWMDFLPGTELEEKSQDTGAHTQTLSSHLPGMVPSAAPFTTEAGCDQAWMDFLLGTGLLS